MDPALKRRLFVAIIVVALIVIFLPVPFGHLQFHQPDTVQQTIPPKPEEETMRPLSQEQAQAMVSDFHPMGQAIPVSQEEALPPMETPDLSAPASEKPSRISRVVKKERAPSHKIVAAPIIPSTSAIQSTSEMSGDDKMQYHLAHQVNDQASAKDEPVATDDSAVVQQIPAGTKSIVITQSDLGGELPKFKLRQADINSPNVAVNHQITKNLDVAKMMNKAWVIQLGSFNDPAITDSVVQRLRKGGLAAFSYKKEVNGQLMYRVYVGPFLQRDQANAELKTITEQYKLSGYVHSFKAADFK